MVSFSCLGNSSVVSAGPSYVRNTWRGTIKMLVGMS